MTTSSEIRTSPSGPLFDVAGAQGAFGGAFTFPYAFSLGTPPPDPGLGQVKLNLGPQNTATEILVSTVDANSALIDSALATIDDSTNPIKGFIRLVGETDTTKWLLFTVTAISAEVAGVRTVSVTCVASSSANPFADLDPILFCFDTSGDKGDTGPTEGWAASLTIDEHSGPTSPIIDPGESLLFTDQGLVTAGSDVIITATGGDATLRGSTGALVEAATGDAELGAPAGDAFVSASGDASVIAATGTARVEASGGNAEVSALGNATVTAATGTALVEALGGDAALEAPTGDASITGETAAATATTGALTLTGQGGASLTATTGALALSASAAAATLTAATSVAITAATTVGISASTGLSLETATGGAVLRATSSSVTVEALGAGSDLSLTAADALSATATAGALSLSGGTTAALTGATGASVTATTGTLTLSALAGVIAFVAALGFSFTATTGDITLTAAAGSITLDGAVDATLRAGSGTALVRSTGGAAQVLGQVGASVTATTSTLALAATAAAATLTAGTTIAITAASGLTLQTTTGNAALSATNSLATVTGQTGASITATTGTLALAATAAAATLTAGSTIGVTATSGLTLQTGTGNAVLRATNSNVTIDAQGTGNDITATAADALTLTATAGAWVGSGGTTAALSSGTVLTLTGGTSASLTATTSTLSLTATAGSLNLTAGAASLYQAATTLTMRTVNGALAILAQGTGAAASLTAANGTATLQAQGSGNNAQVLGANAVVITATAGGIVGTAGTTAAFTGASGASLTATTGTLALAASAAAATLSAGTTITLTGGTGIAATATTGNLDLTASAAAINLSASTLVTINNFLRFTSQAASTPSLSTGQGMFWVLTATPTTPQFTDSANTDWELATLPIQPSDLAPQAEGTTLLRALGTGTGTPIAGSGAQLAQNIRFGTDVEDTTTGTQNAFVVSPLTDNIRFTPASALTINGIAYTGPATPSPAGKEILLYVSRTATTSVTIAHDSASATDPTFRIFCPNNTNVVLNAGDSCYIRYAFSRWILSPAPRSALTTQATAATGTQNDFAINENTDVLIPSADVTFTGFAMTNGNRNGKTLRILVTTANVIVTLASLTGSSAANQIACPAQVNYVLNGRGCIDLQYVSSAWRVVNSPMVTLHAGLNLTPSGALGIVDISTLPVGGAITLQPSADFNIDGFTQPSNNGFWFDLNYRDTTTFIGTLNENAGNVNTSIRNPGATAFRFSTLATVRMRYYNNRWRTIANRPDNFIANDSFLANVSGATANATGKTFTSLVSATTSLSWDATNKRIDYIGSTSNVNSTPSGAAGVIDISTLQCGGSVTFVPGANSTVDGFTAKAEGFWFDIYYNATTAFTVTLNDNVGATTTSIRCPQAVTSFTLTTLQTVRLRYLGSRWRIVATPAQTIVLSQAVAGGTYNDFAIPQNATQVLIDPTGGDVIFTGFAMPTVNGGAFVFRKDLTSDRCILRPNTGSAAANQIITPGGVDFILALNADMVWLVYSASRWFVIERIIPNDGLAAMAANTAKVNATAGSASPTDLAIAAGETLGRAQTGNIVSLSGGNQSSNLRWSNAVIDTTSTGTITSYAPTGYTSGTTNLIRVTPTGNVIIRGMAIAANARLTIRVGRGSSFTVQLNHEDGSANAGEAFNCPDNVNYVMRAGEACIIQNFESRNNIVSVGKIQALRKNSAGTVFTRAQWNLIEGPGITATVADDSTDNEIDITLDQANNVQEDGPTAAGGYEPTLNTNTRIYRVNPAGDFFVVFTGFGFTGGNTGKTFMLVKQGLDGWCQVNHNVGVTASNGVFTPDEQPFILTSANDCAILWYQTSAGRWNIAALGANNAPWQLARQRTPLGTTNVFISCAFIQAMPFTAGGGGAADDVTMYNVNVPFAFILADVWIDVSTAVGGSTITLRTAAGGLGSALTNAMSTAATGTVRASQTGLTARIASESIFMRRSDSGVAGTLVILSYRW